MENVRVLSTRLISVSATEVNNIGKLNSIVLDSVSTSIYLVGQRGFARTSGQNVDFVHLLTDESADFVSATFLCDQDLLVLCQRDGKVILFDPSLVEVSVAVELNQTCHCMAWSPDFDVGIFYILECSRILDPGDEETHIPDPPGFLALDRFFSTTKKHTLVQPTDNVDGGANRVSVGWGAKSTQFQGTAGKLKLQTQSSTQSVENVDITSVQISWRVDGSSFAVAHSAFRCRVVQIFSREMLLLATAEPIRPFSDALTWIPNSHVAVTTLNDVGEYSVGLVERNGMPHGEFSTRSNERVQKLVCSHDSKILATVSEKTLQLWHRSNYHWYLKKRMDFASIEDACFDACVPYKLFIAHDDHLLSQVTFNLQLDRSSHQSNGAVLASIDGSELHIHDFAETVIPLPMSAFKKHFDNVLDRVIVTGNTTESVTTFTNQGLGAAHHCFVSSDDTECTVNVEYALDLPPVLNRACVDGDPVRRCLEAPVAGICRLGRTDDLLVQLEGGTLFRYRLPSDELEPYPFNLPFECSRFFDCVTVPKIGEDLTIGISERFQLAINGRSVLQYVNSAAIHGVFLLFTTLRHRLWCVPLELLGGDAINLAEWCEQNASYSRAVERGASIVTGSIHNTCVILQLPRGNFECVYPRCLVIFRLQELLDECCFREALLLARRHRINMNVLVDYRPSLFHSNRDHFIECLGDSALLNLFMAELSDGDVTRTLYAGLFDDTSERVAKNVDGLLIGIRSSLERLSQEKQDEYFTSLLSTYMRQSKPQVHQALSLVKAKLDAGKTALVDEGLQHMLYTCKIDQMYSAALGTYDFDLVLMVADKTQKDPKEFLPFLNDLVRLDSNYRCFKIDCYLKRFESALSHIIACEDRNEEALQFINQHSLFAQALKRLERESGLYADTVKLYGQYLSKRGQNKEAATVYIKGGFDQEALSCFVSDLDYASALSLSYKLNQSDEQRCELASKLASLLCSGKRHTEAAHLFEGCGKADNAIDALLEGGCWKHARLMIFRNYTDYESREHQIKKRLKPAVLSHCEYLTDQLEASLAKFIRFSDRLTVVRQKKKDIFERMLQSSTVAAEHLDEWESYSIPSTVASSRSVSGESTVSKIRQKENSKKSHKRVMLKENSPYEDLALLRELNEIVERFTSMRAEISETAQFATSEDLDAEAVSLHSIAEKFHGIVSDRYNAIWPARLLPFQMPGPLHELMSTGSEYTSGLQHVDLERAVVGPHWSLNSSWLLKSLFTDAAFVSS